MAVNAADNRPANLRFRAVAGYGERQRLDRYADQKTIFNDAQRRTLKINCPTDTRLSMGLSTGAAVTGMGAGTPQATMARTRMSTHD